jgi:hypothetical protein
LQIKTKIVCCHTADSKPVKEEVNGTVILPLLEFPAQKVAAMAANFILINFKFTAKNANIISFDGQN